MREEVGPQGQVFAFEPQPELADFVGRMIQVVSWQNVLVDCCGLSSEAGERALHAPLGRPSQQASLVVERTDGRSYDLPLKTLDEAFAEHDGRPVSLIKCGVEGHELDVFLGRRATLERDQPRLLFECEERHDRERGVGAVFEYLESLGYVGQVFMGRDLLPLDQFDVRLHQDELKRPPMRTTLPSCIQTVSSYARESSLVHEVSRLPPGPPSLEASLSVATVYAQPKQTTSPVPATTSRWPHNQLIELTPPSAPPSSFARSPGGRPQHRGRRGRSTVLPQPCRCLRPLYFGRRRSPWPVSLICMRKDHMRKDSPENDAGSEVELG